MNIETIIEQAKKQGICVEWHKDMQQNPTLENLCEMFFKGDDWAMDNNFPTPEMLRAFPETVHHGLFVDASYQGSAPQRIAFFGGSDAVLDSDGYQVSEIYLRQNSRLKITAKGMSKIFITALDNAVIEAKAMQNARIVIFDKRKTNNDALEGNIKVIRN
ncbi:hypothetical protein ACFFUE_07305 [Bergeyella porcorum]|uniref:hypothetical protein n=1 Tax=Bergeyella porcorum TaxID=1735111 RepID=UPI0035E68E2E